MSGGRGSAPYGAGARHIFTPPPGTTVQRFRGSIEAFGWNGWYGGFVDSTPRWVWGGGPFTTWNRYQWVDFWPRTNQLFAQVTCGRPGGCRRDDLWGYIYMKDVVVTVEDNLPPSARLTGGSVMRPGWTNGNLSLSFAADDATGIRLVEILVDLGRAVVVEEEAGVDERRP